MSAESDRLSRLDALVSDVTAWAAKSADKVAKIIASQKKILDARGSPSQSASTVAKSVVVEQLKEFTD